MENLMYFNKAKIIKIHYAIQFEKTEQSYFSDLVNYLYELRNKYRKINPIMAD